MQTEEIKKRETTEKDVYKTSRFLYIIEAAVEYFISLLVSGAFLAKAASEIGVSDSLTGILSSFVTLGCAFQLVAIFLANKRPVKGWVTVLHSFNQLFFALVYFVPFIRTSKTAKIFLFVVFLLVGHAVNNVVYSPKINWFMELVDDRKRGRFTATKEMISLIGGMLFSFLIGSVSDRFDAIGDKEGAFLFCGIGILILTVSHSLLLIFSKEKPVQEPKEKTPTKKILGELLKDKDLFKVILVAVLWNVANCASTPFYGTYQIKELGFSMTFVSVLAALYAICRSAFSRPMGALADKYSFKNMLNVCYVIMFVAFTLNAFTVPENGKVLYTLHYILYAVGMAGINSATINLIYDYVDREKRMCALALSGTFSGIAGFLTTLAVSPLLAYIQNNGNQFLGISVYAQQVTSVISSVLIASLFLYVNTVLKKVKNKRQ